MTETSPLQIELRVPSVARVYATRIATALARHGHRVGLTRSPAVRTPAPIDWLLQFEQLIYRTRATAFAPIPEEAGLAGSDAPDLVVDLAGDASDSAIPTLHLLFDEGSGEVGLLGALLAGEAPAVRFVLSQQGKASREIRRALIAVEQPWSVGAALDMVTARLATLTAQAVAVRSAADLTGPHLDAPAPQHDRRATPAVYAAQALRIRIAGRLDRLLRRPDCWRIAVRTLRDDRGLMERRDWSGAGWRMIPDDGRRYYADPFLVAHAGRRWMFCEEYPHATGKGILSVAAIGDDGAIGTPQPFLEASHHLSWPNVFEHDGVMFMVPETGTARSIQLWRAVDFPHRWELDRVLVDDVRAHDPVLHITPDGAFILATLDNDGGSSWDALGVFSAPDVFGPWQAHPGNPLAVDASCMRAAGPLIRRGDELWRATQDCRRGYGAALALCRVTQLDRAGFAQDVVARLAPPPGTGARGVHTVTRLGALEAIDLLGLRGDATTT